MGRHCQTLNGITPFTRTARLDEKIERVAVEGLIDRKNDRGEEFDRVSAINLRGVITTWIYAELTSQLIASNMFGDRSASASRIQLHQNFDRSDKARVIAPSLAL
jgi:hypothetical protein